MLDLSDCLAASIQETGSTVARRGGGVAIPEVDLHIEPHVSEVADAPNGHKRVTLYFGFSQPALFPQGAFEFASGWHPSADDAARQAIALWMQVDFPTLLDAAARRRDHTVWLEFDDQKRRNDHFSGKWLFVVGPLNYQRFDGETSPCCQTCLFTSSLASLRPLFHDRRTWGLKLFAFRNSEGVLSVDCRVNGEHKPELEEAMRLDVESWRHHGVNELRRNYVVLQPV